MVAIGNGIGVSFLKGGGGGAPAPNPDFISVWDTTQSGSASDTIILPLLSGGVYSGTIDWGDGNSDSLSYANRTHIYAASGTYTVTISGTMEDGIGFPLFGGDMAKITEISNWGNADIGIRKAFENCTNLDITATDAPDISTTNMSRCFDNCINLVDINLSQWDVSGVIDFSSFFNDCGELQTANIENWNVGNAGNMGAMFANADEFNEDIGGWDVSNVTSMRTMFNCQFTIGIFNQDISNWNTSNVQDMSFMFQGQTNFNQSIGNWDISSVTTIRRMFQSVSSFDQNLENWDITNVTDAREFLFQSTGLSTANYDATLVGWEATLQAAYPSGVGYPHTINIHFGGSQYTLGGAAEAARTSLISTFGWTITDGGGV